jgi:surface antigen
MQISSVQTFDAGLVDRSAPLAGEAGKQGVRGLARKGRDLAIVGVSVLALSLGACAGYEKTTAGAALGGAGGGLAASAFGAGPAGIAAGVLLGALAGGAIGNALDQADRAAAARAQQQALERAQTGQTITWNNPDSGHYGTYTPKKTYQQSNGTYCREYQQTVTVDGKTESAYGTACRQPDGSWKIVS